MRTFLQPLQLCLSLAVLRKEASGAKSTVPIAKGGLLLMPGGGADTRIWGTPGRGKRLPHPFRGMPEVVRSTADWAV